MYIGFTGSSFYMYKDYIVTTGYYTEYEAIKTEEGLNYKLIYSYNVDGVDYLVETEYYTNNLPNEGAARNIKYNPLNHSQAIVVGGGAGDVLLLVGFMFFIIPLVLQIKNRRQKKKRFSSFSCLKKQFNCYIKKNDATVDITITKSITIAITFPTFSLFMFNHLEIIIL